MIATAQLSRLWASLRARSKGAGGKQWAEPRFTRAELRAWLEAQAVAALAWRCEYQAPGCSEGKFALGITEVSLDHRTPVSAGGATTLENLAVSCSACNRAKGAMSEAEFRALLGVVASWPGSVGRASVMRRLRAAPTWRRSSGAAREAAGD
jgi:5-methylcytosine-specific restriction endonuclease McrA